MSDKELEKLQRKVCGTSKEDDVYLDQPKVPDRVIDAPIPECFCCHYALTEHSPDCAIFLREKIAELVATIRRLEAEKQDARTALERLRGLVSELDAKDDDVKWHSAICCVESLIDKELSKPTLAKQGEPS